MSKNGHSNPAYVPDVTDNIPRKYSLELTEKSNKYDASSKHDSLEYDPYINRVVEHPTT